MKQKWSLWKFPLNLLNTGSKKLENFFLQITFIIHGLTFYIGILYLIKVKRKMSFSFSKNTVFFLSITLLLFFRIYLNTYTNIPLHFDEAQYWSWSQEIAWGYFSKPPLLAWIIGANNYFCGDTEFCIRLPVPILYFLATIFIFFTQSS